MALYGNPIRDHQYSAAPPIPSGSSASQSSSRRYRDPSINPAILADEIRGLKRGLEEARIREHAAVQRATELEQKLQELVAHFKTVQAAGVASRKDADRAQEELQLYKMSYEKAQAEIFRAQGVIEVVDKARAKAETAVSDLKSKLRKQNESIRVQIARDEGRREGLHEGVERGRLLGLQEAQTFAEEEEYYDEEDEFDGYVEPQQRSLYIESNEEIQRPPPPPRDPSPPVPPPRDPSLRVPSPALPPVPIPPPDIQHVPSPRPNSRSIRDASPSGHSQRSIPPDNYIPTMAADGYIPIPAANEFTRQPSPDPSQPNTLPQVAPLQTRPRTTADRRHRNHPQSSPGSITSGMSDMSGLEILSVNNPEYGTRSRPLSAIAERSSHSGSPNPSANDLRHQSSWAGSSHRSNGTPQAPSPQPANIEPSRGDPNAQQRQVNPYTRPRPGSSSSASGPINPAVDRRSNASTVPDINIQTPSRPQSDIQQTGNAGDLLTASERPYQSSMPNPVPGGFPPANGSASMPGNYQAPRSQDTYRRPREDDETTLSTRPDSVASGSSLDTLTTPIHGETRYRGAGSVDTLMTPPPRHPHPPHHFTDWVASREESAGPPPDSANTLQTASSWGPPPDSASTMDTLMTPRRTYPYPLEDPVASRAESAGPPPDTANTLETASASGWGAPPTSASTLMSPRRTYPYPPEDPWASATRAAGQVIPTEAAQSNLPLGPLQPHNPSTSRNGNAGIPHVNVDSIVPPPAPVPAPAPTPPPEPAPSNPGTSSNANTGNKAARKKNKKR